MGYTSTYVSAETVRRYLHSLNPSAMVTAARIRPAAIQWQIIEQEGSDIHQKSATMGFDNNTVSYWGWDGDVRVVYEDDFGQALEAIERFAGGRQVEVHVYAALTALDGIAAQPVPPAATEAPPPEVVSAPEAIEKPADPDIPSFVFAATAIVTYLLVVVNFLIDYQNNTTTLHEIALVAISGVLIIAGPLYLFWWRNRVPSTPARSLEEEERLPIDPTIPIRIQTETIPLDVDAVDAQKNQLTTITVHTRRGARGRVEVRYLKSGAIATSQSLTENPVADRNGMMSWSWTPQPYDWNTGPSKATVTVVYRRARNSKVIEFETRPRAY